MSDSTANPTPARPWRAGAEAAWANRWPGAALSAFAVTLLLAYFYVEPVRDALQRVADFKETVGWPFAIVSTALFGAVLPWLVQRLRPAYRGETRWSHLLFLAAFWGYKGAEIDWFYKLQAHLVGDAATLGIITVKVLIDQCLYVPLWAVPTTVLAYRFKDEGFDVGRLRRVIFEDHGGLGGWVRARVLPVLVSNWAVWLPAVVVIYALPQALQLPIQNLVLCFWALLLVLQVRD